MKRNILILDDHDDLASALCSEFTKRSHEVISVNDLAEAMRLMHERPFDILIADMDGKKHPSDPGIKVHDQLNVLSDLSEGERSNTKAFKISFADFDFRNFDEMEVGEIVKTTLNFKAKFIDRGKGIENRREKINFEVPSVISLMDYILDYLTRRVEKLGVITPNQSNLFVALDEAFVNAVKHGNKFNPKKLVRISVEISPKKASFTIEDEGKGFKVDEIPDPANPENLFKTSGRGVMFIYNIMDEVSYNIRGNRLTMTKNIENPTSDLKSKG